MTPWQIRAARGITGWSQTELAERAGVSLPAVTDCEKERAKTSLETYEKFVKAFEQEAIFFTETGVERRSTATYEIVGDDWWLDVLDDVYYELIDNKDAELLLLFADDRESSDEVNNRIRKIRNTGVKMRQLVAEGNSFLMGPTNEYKWVPKEYFHNRVTLIYGPKVVVCAEDNTKALVIKDEGLAATWKNLFNLLWSGVQISEPERSTADERF
jgi:DNA-binding XRE family transcriptional regulator